MLCTSTGLAPCECAACIAVTNKAVAAETDRCVAFVEKEAQRFLRGPQAQSANTMAQNHAIGTRLREAAAAMREGR